MALKSVWAVTRSDSATQFGQRDAPARLRPALKTLHDGVWAGTPAGKSTVRVTHAKVLGILLAQRANLVTDLEESLKHIASLGQVRSARQLALRLTPSLDTHTRTSGSQYPRHIRTYPLRNTHAQRPRPPLSGKDGPGRRIGRQLRVSQAGLSVAVANRKGAQPERLAPRKDSKVVARP